MVQLMHNFEANYAAYATNGNPSYDQGCDAKNYCKSFIPQNSDGLFNSAHLIQLNGCRLLVINHKPNQFLNGLLFKKNTIKILSFKP